MPYRPSDIPERLVLGVWGEPKTGKTHFCLTAPQPLYFLNTDYGVSELLRRPEFRSLDIQIEDIPILDPGNHKSARDGLARFHEQYLAWLEEANATKGTVIVDNASFLWQLISVVKLEEAKRARFEKQSKVKNLDELKDQRFDYGPVNLYTSGLLRRAFHYPNVNLILTHKSRRKYNERGEETNLLEWQGFGETPAIVQAMLQTFKNGAEFAVMIEKSRHAPEQEGFWYPSPTWELVKLMLLEGAA